MIVLEILLALWLIGVVIFLVRIINEAPKHSAQIGIIHIIVAILWPIWLGWYSWTLFSDWLRRRRKNV